VKNRKLIETFSYGQYGHNSVGKTPCHFTLFQRSDSRYFFNRKSLKSLFFLLPLLGITNVLHFVWPNPLRGTWLSFAVWSFTSHFLYSFQGFFVASVYFFFDDKVSEGTFHQFCARSFTHADPKREIKTDDLTDFFALFGSE